MMTLLRSYRMRIKTLAALVALSLAGTAMHTLAAEGRYYDPSNVASETGLTTDHELNKTIGCPGKGLLDAPCKVPDSDGDGVDDYKDRCPGTVAGAKVDAQGCELDADGDGVVDRLDACPGTPAGRKVDAQGCELDGDKDGIVDALDQCPSTPEGRKVDAQGCQLDGDKDGIVDALDQCPDTPAGDKVDNKGCTLLNTIVLKGVNFDNDLAVLHDDASAILDDAVAIFKRYPALKVEVAGHTDSSSSDTYNQQLSERRAKAVMEYFVGKGVAAEQLTAKGYGESQPVADNGTAEGRAQNRRVELRVLN
jgi:OOP family OmpA-OmpF porin